MSSLRVLVIDDYEPFRRVICSTLASKLELQIVGEAADGLEAVQKAEELQPDLIVLDLGLPTLNGIEAARRICKLSPKSKILVVTQESSSDVVEEAFRSGAVGYVVKSHVGSELLAAVEEVCQGRQFISGGLSGLPFAHGLQDRDRVHDEEAIPARRTKRGETVRSHAVQFYPDHPSFLAGFSSFVEAALLAGNAVIVVVTEAHRKSLVQMLQEHTVNVAAAIEEGRYLSLDVEQTLSNFMVNDLPDPGRFLKVTGDLVTEAATAAKGESRRVAACGECAPTLWAQGNADAAIQLEHLWDEIAKKYCVGVLCGYVVTDFQREQEARIWDRICAEHSAVWSG
jgi:DNA-binding NarL/FixJ family response regulator